MKVCTQDSFPYQICFQLTFVDEVSSGLEGRDLGHASGNGNEVHVSGSSGRQLAPGLLFIDDKNTPKVNHLPLPWHSLCLVIKILPGSVRKYLYVTRSVCRKQSHLTLADHSYSPWTEMRYITYTLQRTKKISHHW